jgi:hypothetical protein
VCIVVGGLRIVLESSHMAITAVSFLLVKAVATPVFCSQACVSSWAALAQLAAHTLKLKQLGDNFMGGECDCGVWGAACIAGGGASQALAVMAVSTPCWWEQLYNCSSVCSQECCSSWQAETSAQLAAHAQRLQQRSDNLLGGEFVWFR